MLLRSKQCFSAFFLYFRCFESGVYDGFFKSNGDVLFRSLVEQYGITAVVYEHVYNNWDVTACKRSKGRFFRLKLFIISVTVGRRQLK